MKIICTDNYARENKSDTLVCENVNEPMGTKIVKLLNNNATIYGDDFYKLVADDHKLYKFEP